MTYKFESLARHLYLYPVLQIQISTVFLTSSLGYLIKISNQTCETNLLHSVPPTLIFFILLNGSSVLLVAQVKALKSFDFSKLKIKLYFLSCVLTKVAVPLMWFTYDFQRFLWMLVAKKTQIAHKKTKHLSLSLHFGSVLVISSKYSSAYTEPRNQSKVKGEGLLWSCLSRSTFECHN